MKKIIVAVSAVIAVGFSSQANAWGDREQGALAGLIVGAIAQKAFSQPGQNNGYPPVFQGLPQQYPVYQPAPPPQVIYTPPMREHCEYVPLRSPYGHYYGEKYVCRLIPTPQMPYPVYQPHQ
jgi:hypothetical protein